MNRFILRFRGTGRIPAEDMDEIRAMPDTKVVDSTARMLLVEGSEDALKEFVQGRPEWLLSVEQNILLPDPRVKPRPPPDPSRGAN